MSYSIAIGTQWDKRIARAATLARQLPEAAELLIFYSEILKFQESLDGYLFECPNALSLSASDLPRDLDICSLLPKLQPFLCVVETHAPAELSEAARRFALRNAEESLAVLCDYWSGSNCGELIPGERFIAHAFLQPVASFLANDVQVERGPNYAHPICPFCTRKPVAGTLRPEGDGGKRSLVCSFCSVEWQFRRVLCPACGETDLERLPVYIADDFPYIRIESCETCKAFIKTVDLTKNGHADPIVDDLATVSLTLWAQQKGYTKVEPNLLGM